MVSSSQATRYAVVVLSCIGLAACMGAPGGGALGESASTTVITEYDVMPAPSDVDITAGGSAFAIGAFDVLTIDVFGIDGLSGGDVTVDGQGFISFPLAGTLRAAGQSTSELTQQLRERLKESYVRNPQVSVNLKASNSKFVSVSGQVNRPGLYPVLPSTKLSTAVASAAGASEFAAIDDVVVLRTVGEQRFAALYNLAAIERGNLEDPPIYPGDLIVVGESSQRRLFDSILKTAPLLTTPLILLLQN